MLLICILNTKYRLVTKAQEDTFVPVTQPSHQLTNWIDAKANRNLNCSIYCVCNVSTIRILLCSRPAACYGPHCSPGLRFGRHVLLYVCVPLMNMLTSAPVSFRHIKKLIVLSLRWWQHCMMWVCCIMLTLLHPPHTQLLTPMRRAAQCQAYASQTWRCSAPRIWKIFVKHVQKLMFLANCSCNMTS